MSTRTAAGWNGSDRCRSASIFEQSTRYLTSPVASTCNSPYLLVVGGSGQLLLGLGRSPALGLLPLGGVAVSIVEGLHTRGGLPLYVHSCSTNRKDGSWEIVRSTHIVEAILAALEPRRQTCFRKVRSGPDTCTCPRKNQMCVGASHRRMVLSRLCLRVCPRRCQPNELSPTGQARESSKRA